MNCNKVTIRTNLLRSPMNCSDGLDVAVWQILRLWESCFENGEKKFENHMRKRKIYNLRVAFEKLMNAMNLLFFTKVWENVKDAFVTIYSLLSMHSPTLKISSSWYCKHF
jgi:hypothetical protein